MGFGEEKGKRKREIEKRKKPAISLFAAMPYFRKGGTTSAQDNLKLWETHIRGEFVTKDTDLSLDDGRRRVGTHGAYGLGREGEEGTLGTVSQ
jgi:hypothetical protein